MFRMPIAKVLKHTPDVVSEFYKILNRNVEKMVSFLERLEQNTISSKVCVYNNNACSLKDVPDNFFDLIITSPPYGDSRTTVAYGEFSRLSLQWLDLFELTDKEIMSIDKTLMGGEKYRNGFEFTLQSLTLRESLEKSRTKILNVQAMCIVFMKILIMQFRALLIKLEKVDISFG